MLYRDVMAGCSEIHTKHVNTLWEECRIFSVKLGGNQVGFKGTQDNFASLNICVHRHTPLGPQEVSF
jgi:hypothetical protein